MSVIRPNKFFSRDGVIKQIINTPEESVGDIVTWITSATQSVNENIAKDITLSASSSLGGDIVYSIIGGVDQALFNIVGAVTLRLASKNFESPSDNDINNTYIVIVRATSSAGGSADIAITVTVTDVNEQDFFSLTGSNVTGDSPTWSVSVINSVYGTPDNIAFSSAGYQYLKIANTDQSSSELEVSIEATGGTFTLANDFGLTFSVGDGTNDTLMTFSGSISNINNALNGMVVSSGVTSFIVNIIDGEFNTTDTINISHSNGTVEQQLITFNSVPTSGSWLLGYSGAQYVTLQWSDSAASIQTDLRNYVPITDNWGTNLTVTGNYTIGFTITAAKYGNQTDLYINTESLLSLQSINTYIEDVSAATWNGFSSANGAPNGGYTDFSLGPLGSSDSFLGKLIFSGFPEVVPEGIEITTYVNGPVYDNSISLKNYTTSSALGDDKANIIMWNNLGYKSYGSSVDKWGAAKSAAEWQALLAEGGDGLGINIIAFNPDSSYTQSAQIDAVLATVYYNVISVGSVSTITNG